MSELRRMRRVEDENRRLKGLVADLTLDKHVLSEPSNEEAEDDARPGATGSPPAARSGY